MLIDELLENCIYDSLMINDVYCMRFTSKNNGGKIFLPAVERYYDENEDTYFYNDSHGIGYYWTSTQIPNQTSDAYCLMINLGFYSFFECDASWYEGWDANDRFNSYNVRPIWVP